VSQDYNEAVQNPDVCFGDPELRAAEPVTNALGLPLPCSGNFADVYHLRHPGGESWAVKCFTRSVAGRQERYHEISRHLGRVRLPFTIDFSYLEEGIRVHGRWYPVVKMQWIEGLLLNQFIRDHLHQPAVLEALLNLWMRMARRLREAEVAHGDLQHGNVLLVPGSRTTSLALRLIDYDGLFVPALAGQPAAEVGHPAYQHPQRLREGTCGPEVDRVPLLVIATALRGLVAAGARLWKRYDNGDNLLFREADLRAPEESVLFGELWRLSDPLTHVLVARLALACQDPIDQAPLVTELLAEDLLPVLSAEQKARAEELLGSDGATVSAPSPLPSPPGGEGRGEGAPSGDFDFAATRPARRRRRRVASGVVIAWVWVAFVTLALVVTLPILCYFAPEPTASQKAAGIHDPAGAAIKDKKTGSGGPERTKPPRPTGKESDGLPP
jgi:hypothetical protein